jgi:four helix bundle protein
MKMIEALPASRTANAIGNQLVRSATSVGANYRAACRARSAAEFIAKLGIAEEEADESGYWLELIMEGGLLQSHLVSDLHNEAGQLQKILTASRLTALKNKSKIETQKSKIKDRT